MVLKLVSRILKHFKSAVLSILVWIIIFIPFLLIAAFPLLLLRLVVHFLARIFRPNLIQVTKLVDSLFAFIPSKHEPGLNASQIWRVKGKLDVDEFRQHFYNCFLSTEELRQKYENLSCCIVEWMFYCFKKPLKWKALDLQDHIRPFNLAQGVTLETFVGIWMSQGTYGSNLNKEVPNWEILILNNQNSSKLYEESPEIQEEESIVLLKINHGLSDGYTFIHMVEKLSGVKGPYNFREEKISLWTKIKLIFMGPKILLEYLITLAWSHDLLYPQKNPRISPKWFISFATFDLKIIKDIRKKTKSRFNCIVQAAFVGALRRHFLETSRVSKVSELPLTVFVGSPQGWVDHPAMIQGGMTNHFTVGAFRVPLRSENSLERLILADEDCNRYYALYLHKLIYYLVFGFLWAVPAGINRFARKHGNFGILRVTTYVSPLMLSSQPCQLMGHPVEFLYLPLLVRSVDPSTTMYVIPVSHSGKVDLSINASSQVIKDQAELDRFTQVYFIDELIKLDSIGRDS